MKSCISTAIVSETIDKVLSQRLRLMPSGATALMIQSSFRAWQARKLARKLRDTNLINARNCQINSYATEIQRHIRGFLSRRNVVNFFERRRFISDVLRGNQEMDLLLKERRRVNVAIAGAVAESRARRSIEAFASRSHHLVSTKAVRGVFAPIFGCEALTPWGVPMEALIKQGHALL